MSATSRLPQADPLYARPLPDRPAYATGMLLDAQDFADEQTYHRGRLARALAHLAGGGTLAGLRVAWRAEVAAGPDAHPEEIRVEPGVAVDRLGRLIELPRPACIRLGRWFDAEAAAGRVRPAAHDAGLDAFLSARSLAEDGAPPARALVADVFVRFLACERGYTPSFAAGPFDALDAVATARLRDACELRLVPRPDLDPGRDGLPSPGPGLAGVADPAERRARLQDAVLAAYPPSGRAGSTDELDPLAEHPPGSTAAPSSSPACWCRWPPATRRRATPRPRRASTTGAAASCPRCRWSRAGSAPERTARRPAPAPRAPTAPEPPP